jgi:hypothetical protein
MEPHPTVVSKPTTVKVFMTPAEPTAVAKVTPAHITPAVAIHWLPGSAVVRYPSSSYSLPKILKGGERQFL